MKPTLGPTLALKRLREKRPDKEYIESLSTADSSRFLVLAGAKPVVDSNEDRTNVRLHWFTGPEITEMGLALNEAIFLGIDPADDAAKFAVATSEHYARGAPRARDALKNRVEIGTLAAQGSMSETELALVSQAAALATWHENHRCCGRCGGSTTCKHGGWKRKCWACGFEAFPRIDLIVIMAVTDGERILLAHEDRFPDKMFSPISGYVEPGDDITHAVRRGTKEEVGLDVGDVHLIGSQPWPFPHSLMLGCIAHTEPNEPVAAAAEIEEVRWFTKEEARALLERRHPQELWLPGPQSMAHHLVKEFLSGAN